MKKVFLLIFTLLCITGCYDYKELNNLAIVSGIAIDYQDEFIVNYEIINSQKSEDPFIKSYMVEGRGNTIVEAFQNADDMVAKETYLSHLKVLILGKEAAEEKLKEIVDYMIRDPYIRNIFSPVVASNVTAKELLSSTNKETPVVSEKIASMIRNNEYTENISSTIDFDQFVDQYEDKRIDPTVTSIELKDGKSALSGMGIFQDLKFKNILDKENAAIFNVLDNSSSNHKIKIPCETDVDGFTIINLYQNKKTQFEVTEEKVKISSNLKGGVLKDSCGNNFRDSEVYEEMNQKAEEILKKEYENFWKIITEEKTDILGLQKKYYQKTRKELSDWQKLKLEIDITININKNGKIFEVKSNE